jgi:hypothetical protein
MNAMTQVARGFELAAWDEATGCVNAWRGHGLHCFAQAEWAVSETLVTLRATLRGAETVRLRPLVGHRFEDLRGAIGPDGPFACEGKKTIAAFDDFTPHLPLRPFLAHGIAKVALDRNGQWLVVLKTLNFRSGKEERASLTYDQKEAERELTKLKETTLQLGPALQSLRDRIRAPGR